MNYSTRPLSDLCEIVIGRTPSRNNAEYWGSGNKWVSISDLTSRTVTETKEEITDLAVKQTNSRRIPQGTLLLSFKLTIGKLSFAGHDLYTNEAIAALKVRDETILSSNYLYFALKAAKLSGANRAVMGETLNSKSLAQIPIPLPPFEDQGRIAQLLGNLESLIVRRKEQIAALDELVQSVFLEMFGDPVRNEKGWKKEPLMRLGDLDRGVSRHRPRNAPELLGGKYPLIQTGEVSNANTYITSFTQTFSELGLSQSKMWPAGTLCITIAANIAKTAILTFDACFPDSVVGFTPLPNETNVIYIHTLFGFFQKMLEKNAPAAAQKNINLEILRGLEVPKPPIDLQHQFAHVFEKVQVVKKSNQQNLRDLETLYNALSQKAFSGELDLSRIPLAKVDFVATAAGPTIELSGSAAAFMLPFPEPGRDLSDIRQRRQTIDEWLGIYVDQLGEETSFSTQDFIDAVNPMLTRKDDGTAWGATEYDQLKEWVFDALSSGKLAQAINERGNLVVLSRARRRPTLDEAT